MSEPRWTKGPWRLADDAQGPCMILHPSREGVAIASLTATFKPGNGFNEDWLVFHSNGMLDTAATDARIAERNANAHLIAAAPDLYDALKGALAAIEIVGECLGDMDAMRAALAKAEGRTPPEEPKP